MVIACVQDPFCKKIDQLLGYLVTGSKGATLEKVAVHKCKPMNDESFQNVKFRGNKNMNEGLAIVGNFKLKK